MDAIPAGASKSPRRPGITGVVMIYVAISALWIAASDRLLTLSTTDPALLGRLSAIKGFAFVAVTGALLYLLLKVWQEPARSTGEAASVLSKPRTGRRALLFVGLVALVPLIGFGVVKLYTPLQEREVHANLRAIADLKTSQIENWLSEREGDARVLAADAGFAERVAQWRREGAHAPVPPFVRARLQALLQMADYDGISLLSTDGRSLLSLGERRGAPNIRSSLLARALATGKVQRTDLIEAPSGVLQLAFIAPVVAQVDGKAQPVAGVLFHIDPQRFLFPYLRTWPSASPSGETSIVRAEGDSVVFLNAPRHRQGKALSLRIPAANKASLPAAVAVREARKGTLAAIDYRGVAVLAAYGPVAGTDWHIVAKIDRNEALAPVQTLAMWVAAIVFFAIAALGAAAVLLWRQQRRNDLMVMQAEATKAREAGNRRYRAIAWSAHDAIISTDMNGKIVAWNPAAERIFGYGEAEILGQPWTTLMAEPAAEAPASTRLGRLAKGHTDTAAQCVEGVARRKDGTAFPIEFSLGQWESPEGVYHATILRDITQRKQVERQLAASEQNYRTLANSGQALIWAADTDKLCFYFNLP
ncbi:MAG: PAS domain S-box protein, partial [Rhodocyclaceae bacterium]